MDWELVINNVVTVIGVVLTGAALVGAIIALNAHIKRLVDKRVDSPETIDKLSKLIRPAVIFDNEGRVLADLGAMEYIESICVTGSLGPTTMDSIRIEVECKKFLDLPPLLTLLDTSFGNTTPTRTGKFGWIFELGPMSYSSDDATFRFRLEVLR